MAKGIIQKDKQARAKKRKVRNRRRKDNGR